MAIDIPLSAGATSVANREAFEFLARRDDVPGALGTREVKLLMTGVDTAAPVLYFINTNTFVFHFDFATKGLGMRIRRGQFNQETYFRDARKNIAATLLAFDDYLAPDGTKGLYALEFWPTDPVNANHVSLAFNAVRAGLPFAATLVAYQPAGETQQALAVAQKEQLASLGVRTIDTQDLFGSITYSPLNLGEGYGLLRVIEGARPNERPPTVRDVVIFKTLPNDLSHVAGVITEMPQTPLSHVNLKAKQNDTPNAYVKNASTDERVKPLIGKVVHYKVTPDDFNLDEATQADADAFLERVRPKLPQTPPRDLTVTQIRGLDGLTHADVKGYGAKAANVGELRRFLPRNVVPDGYAVPLSYYDTFMTETGLYDKARKMMGKKSFAADPAKREAALEKFRERIEDEKIPGALAKKLRAMQQMFPDETPLRCRSSTNNEDLEGFSGAGLYDSFTHRPDEGKIDKTIRQVWASLWNFRAYEEREFYRINHFATAMAVLVHPNFDDEGANGVAVTKNPYDPNFPGFYVNVQVGEELVTNPEGGAIPDEFLISAIGEQGEYETQYIRHSSLTNGKNVLTNEQIEALTEVMEQIQSHFRVVYGKQQDPAFAMDIEFKIAAGGGLIVKQARPWVE
ncbi:MAG TPA: PEP/pyruvate-binding domain-containing protein [Thermoanaerobaculia bacterium]|jgi:hypothetical protein